VLHYSKALEIDLEMLFMIGLGLGDEKDITLKGLEAIKSSDRVFLESYTSILGVNQEVLVLRLSFVL
jgi:diphthamide biosynthesis methyltransferase